MKSTRKHGGKPRQKRVKSGSGGGRYWLYGDHAVAAALANPARQIFELLCGEGKAAPQSTTEAPRPSPRSVGRRDIEALLPPGAVHQGIACLVAPLSPPSLDDIIALENQDILLVVLDQVTDPHNVGAIIRSSAGFGVQAVIVPRHNAPPESGAMAKAASGGLDRVPMVTVANLGRALEQLAKAGFWCLGLDGAAQRTLAETKPAGRIALVLGAEGHGLRRLTRDYCDELVRLPTVDDASLNVSAAAAAALYEFRRG